jgi:hypothetical protein
VTPAALAETPWQPGRRGAAPQRLYWLAIAAAIHALALFALWQLKAQAPIREWGIITTLRLLPLQNQTPRAAPRMPPRSVRVGPPAPHPPPAPHTDAPAVPSAAPPPDTQAPAHLEPQPITPAPLNLRLPDAAASAPPTLRSQVLNDTRVVSRRSYGQRFADTLGTDTTVHEERLNDGSIRLRQGSSCVILKESAAARLDPFSQTYMPAPRMASKCPE